MAQPDYLADHEDGGWIHFGPSGRDSREGRLDDTFARSRSVLDESHRLRSVPPGPDQAFGDVFPILHAHQHDQRVDARVLRPVDRNQILAVSGDRGKRSGHTAARGRDAGQRRYRNGRGYSGNDCDLDAMPDQIFPLLGSTPEDHRVAALEPNHGSSLCGVADHEVVDLVLDLLLLALALAAVDEHRVRG